MKTTIEIDGELFRQLKSTAALRGKKIRELVTEGVRLILKSPPSQGKPGSIELPLINSKRKVPLNIPDDVAYRLDAEDL